MQRTNKTNTHSTRTRRARKHAETARTYARGITLVYRKTPCGCSTPRIHRQPANRETPEPVDTSRTPTRRLPLVYVSLARNSLYRVWLPVTIPEAVLDDRYLTPSMPATRCKSCCSLASRNTYTHPLVLNRHDVLFAKKKDS